MNTRLFRIALAAIVLLLPLAAVAQEAKPARIGVLRASPPLPQYIKQFHAGMRERGHTEGRTYELVPGWGKSRRDRDKILQLAENLVARGVEDGVRRVGKRDVRSDERSRDHRQGEGPREGALAKAIRQDQEQRPEQVELLLYGERPGVEKRLGVRGSLEVAGLNRRRTAPVSPGRARETGATCDRRSTRDCPVRPRRDRCSRRGSRARAPS